MKKILALTVVALVLGAVVACVAEEAAPVTVTVKGTVMLTKEADAVKTIEIKKDDATMVKVAMDDEGKKLIEMAGKVVEATGTMKEGMLVVKSCKAVEAATM